MNLYPSQLPGQRVHWLLEIKWGGLVIRLADDQVDVESETGTVYQYAPGLDAIEVSEAIELFNDSAGQLSVPLEFVAPPGASITERISLGDDFSAATGELSRWVSGTSYEARRVVLVGRLTDPEYGADGEPIATSLDEVLIYDSSLIPSTAQAVTEATWGAEDLEEPSLNAPYPIVIGKPGRVASAVNAAGWITGSPGIWVEHGVVDEGTFYYDMCLLIAGHHVKGRRVYLDAVTKDEVARWQPGDVLLLNGKLLTGRDAAHKRMVEMLDRGEPLPVDLRGKFIYYVGPVDPVRDEVVGPAGPTTATRMDKFTRQMLEQTGLLGMVGKAERGPAAIEAIRDHGAAYLMAVGGSAYLVSKAIKAARVVGFADLGMEAIYEFEVRDMPVTVAVDARGTSVHQTGPRQWAARIAGIPVVVEG